jgi:hypothetical protein
MVPVDTPGNVDAWIYQVDDGLRRRFLLSRPRTTRSSKLPTTKPSRIQRQTAPMEAPNEAVAAEIKSSVVADNNVDDEVS